MIPALSRWLQSLDDQITPEEVADVVWLWQQVNTHEPQERGKPVKPSLADQSNPASGQSNFNRMEGSRDNTESRREEDTDKAYLSTKTGNDDRSRTAPKPSKSLNIQVPEAPALAEPLVLARALKPLKRRHPSDYQRILDEEATVQRIVDQELWIPVEQAAPERWFDLSVVVDDTPTVAIWEQAITEWIALLQSLAAFRNVRLWYLRGKTGQAFSSAESSASPAWQWRISPQRSGQGQSPRVLIEPGGRHLILVLSDCMGTGWQQGAIFTLLQGWADYNPVTVMQLMPEQQWDRTVLGRGRAVQLRAGQADIPNDRLQVAPLPIWAAPLNLDGALKLPIVTFDRFALANWAAVMTGVGGVSVSGVVFESAESMTQQRSAVPSAGLEPLQTEELSALERVQRFRAVASPGARHLAGLLAAGPVNLSVARLIQRSMLPETGAMEVAEVFLGGLIRLEGENPNPQEQNYAFLPGVREVLLGTVRVSEADEVLDRVSEYIGARLGYAINSFEALLELYPQLEGEGRDIIAPFAKVIPEVLKRLGGSYAEISQELDRLLNDKWNISDTQSPIERLDQLLDRIVESSNGDIAAIVIFDPVDGLPLYVNPGLKLSDPDMYDTFLGEDGIGKVSEALSQIGRTQDALNNLGENIKYGDLQQSIFRLTAGTIIVNFRHFPGVPIAIYSFSTGNITLETLDRIIMQVRKNINLIDEALVKTIGIDYAITPTDFEVAEEDDLIVNFQESSASISITQSDLTLSPVKRMDQLVNRIVENSNGDIAAILIVDLLEGLPLYVNSGLKLSDPDMYDTFLGDDGMGKVSEALCQMGITQYALKNLGENIKYGDLYHSIFRLTSGIMIIYFRKCGLSLTIAICFWFPGQVPLGRASIQAIINIDSINQALRNAWDVI